MYHLYYDKISVMNEKQLLAEIENVRKKVMAISASSMMYEQMLQMLEIAETHYAEMGMKQNLKTASEVINIGEIDSLTEEPDYSTEELINVIVTGYTTK